MLEPAVYSGGPQPGRKGEHAGRKQSRSMRIDQDGCTFWYTTEYYQLTASFDWSTQIASAKFVNCQ